MQIYPIKILSIQIWIFLYETKSRIYSVSSSCYPGPMIRITSEYIFSLDFLKSLFVVVVSDAPTLDIDIILGNKIVSCHSLFQ